MSPRDATASRERIVEAASTEFTRRGFAGARVEEIANRAQCNKALVYHYFEDKASLFKHVLQCKMAHLSALAVHEGDASAFAELAGEVFDFYSENPELTRLAMWEALDFGAHNPVPNEEERRARFAERVADVERAQQAGIVDPALDARHLLITLMGIVTHWFAFPQNARLICSEDPFTPEALKLRRAHVVEVARRIIERK
jgi:AcrR family transcriptional regulator